MRSIASEQVAEAVREAVVSLAHTTEPATLDRLVRIAADEPSPAGRLAMAEIVENRRISARRQVPMCQDTGMLVIFAEVGEEVRTRGLRAAIEEGVRTGAREAHYRASVVREPLFDRHSTGDNTPPVVHFDLVPGDRLTLRLLAKGFGAENMSRARVLTPGDGVEGVIREVVRVVEDAGAQACPPIVVGVGLGGTLETATLLAKRALLRGMGSRNPDPRYAALEEELLRRVNATGIGPQGWGGANTAMDARVEYHPTHIAGLPVAVNLDCHLQRHREVVL